MTSTRCPYCGRPFVVEDIHRPVRCPHCGAEVLLTPTDQEGEGGVVV